MQNKVIDKKRDENKYEKITIDTPYGTIESDSGNHFLDIATILVIILGCAVAKYVWDMTVKCWNAIKAVFIKKG